MNQPAASQLLINARRHYQAGRLPEAEKSCREMLAADPKNAEAMHLLGRIASLANRPDIACRWFAQSVQIQPRNADALLDLANALLAVGQIEQAITVYQSAIQARADFGEAFTNLGIALAMRGRLEEAIPALRRAVSLRPNLPEAHDALGIALRMTGSAEEAVTEHRIATQLKPDFAAAHSNLGLALVEIGAIEPAVAEYRKALQIVPGLKDTHTSLLYAMHFLPRYDAAAIFAEHLEWNRKFTAPLSAQSHSNDRNPDRRLRVGYVSADFRHHSVSFFIERLLAGHDQNRIEVYCYADIPKRDQTTDRLQKLTPNWREITGRPDDDVLRIVRQDQIDILVDLSGHTGGNRLMVFARKPAPIQVSYLGYIDTTGVAAIDYRLTDAHADPPGRTEHLYTEQLIRLPRTFACYTPPEGAPPVSPLPATSKGFVTFGSFTTLSKINPPLLECWSRILTAVAGSRMIITAKGLKYGSVQKSIRAVFEAKGIARERLVLRDERNFQDYLSAHHDIDILLDTFPVNGHTVTCHALWMGAVPISLAGDTYCQRLGASVLHNLNLPQLIAGTPEQYEQIARELTSDLTRLAQFRSSMRKRMSESPFMDRDNFVRDVENVLRAAWQQWCASEPLQTIRADRPDLQVVLKQIREDVEAKRFSVAEALCRQLLADDPHQPEALRILGRLARLGRRPELAIELLTQSLKFEPGHPEGLLELGASLEAAKQTAQAMVTLRAAVQANPHNPRAHYMLGTALIHRGKMDEAISVLQQALALKPDDVAARNNLAGALLSMNRVDDAIEQYRISRSLGASVEANLGAALAAGARYYEAIECLESAAANPRDAALVQGYLANAYKGIGNIEQAITCYDRSQALQAEPVNADNRLYALHFSSKVDSAKLMSEYQRWEDQYAAALQKNIAPHDNNRDPDRRLRIGYVSPDFRNHSVAFFFEPLLANHDPARIESFCYADLPNPDWFSTRLKALPNHWREITGLDDEEVAQLVRKDRIDILVDLAGHTAGGRLLMFARKPAPVQISYLGYPATTGLSAMDYRITDAWLDPPGTSERFYREQLIRLPETFACFKPADASFTGPVSPLPALANGFITFGSYNSTLSKISPAAMDSWASILKKLPTARLVMVAKGLQETRLRDQVLRQWKERGIEANRIDLNGVQAFKDYFTSHNRVDVLLDTFPLNGHTTTCHALWMGVPPVCLAGATAWERMGLSVLQNAGLAELVATSPERYEEIALDLAMDIPRLADLRGGMRDRLIRAPLLNAEAFTKHAEAAYRAAWRKWCGQPK